MEINFSVSLHGGLDIEEENLHNKLQSNQELQKLKKSVGINLPTDIFKNQNYFHQIKDGTAW